MDACVEAHRELLLAMLRRHADALPTSVVLSLSAAADELVDPLVPPTLSQIDESETADPLGVVKRVRRHLYQAIASAERTPKTFACARAARELAAAERTLSLTRQ